MVFLTIFAAMGEDLALGYFADVVLPLALPKLYTYRIAEKDAEITKPGMRVVVQFGAKKVYAALVWKVHHQPPQSYEAKYILSTIDAVPLLPEPLRNLWDFISSYYMATLGEVMIAGLPSGLKMESETRIALRPGVEILADELNDLEYLIVEALQATPELSVRQVMEIVQLENVYQLIRKLFEKEVIYIREELIQSYKPKKETYFRLGSEFHDEEALSKLMTSLEKSAPRQLDTLLQFYQYKGKKIEFVKHEFLQMTQDPNGYNALKKKGVFEEFTKEISRFDMSLLASQTFTLNPDQKLAVKEIHQAWKEKDTVLLFGVTSSGKTHVYVHLIEEAIKEGKQALMLLPEIGLTGQMVDRLRKFFGARVMVTHSKFNENERVEIWRKIQEGQVSLIIGPRSAVFMPFHNLGVVIVDEEHDASYKQQDPAPRYHGRDVAIFLAKLHQCKVLLGSATPSLESYFLALHGRYGLVTIKNRHGGVNLPAISLADIAYDKEAKIYKNHFTLVLRQELKETLNNRKQAIIFQNRRGYIPLLECEHCGWVPKCHQCDVSLTLHKYNNTLKCHYCGYSKPTIHVCEACHSPVMHNKGFGTEMIQEDLETLFPQARVSRMDLETTRTKGGHQKIIEDLQENKTDILVGTQMVTKGLDFESVVLVGVVNADQMLNFPDFRAHERTFQMLAQVSGRAGRREQQGRVIIQSSRVTNPVLQFVVEGDFEGFYAHEILQRQRFRYPPYYRLLQIICKAKSETELNICSRYIADSLRQKLGGRVLGPEAPLVKKIKNLYIQQILIKIERDGPSPSGLKKWLGELISMAKSKHKQVIIVPDVDPVG